MIKRPATESPSKTGLYFCEVEKERMGNKFTLKSVLWYSVDAGRWMIEYTPDRVVAWYDDVEENQETVWVEILKQLDSEIENNDGFGKYVNRNIEEWLMNHYTIYRK